MNNLQECIVHNPATEEVVARYPYISHAEIENKIVQTYNAWLKWRKSSLEQRSACTKKLAELLIKNINEYAGQITLEMGKPIFQAEQEIKKCAWTCEYYSEHAAEYLAPQTFATEMRKSYVLY